MCQVYETWRWKRNKSNKKRNKSQKGKQKQKNQTKMVVGKQWCGFINLPGNTAYASAYTWKNTIKHADYQDLEELQYGAVMDVMRRGRGTCTYETHKFNTQTIWPLQEGKRKTSPKVDTRLHINIKKREITENSPKSEGEAEVEAEVSASSLRDQTLRKDGRTLSIPGTDTDVQMFRQNRWPF